MLVVSVGHAAGQVPLTTDAERKTLQKLLPDTCTELTDDAATRDAVRAGLADHSWVHFNCHGDQDLLDPSSGGLWLHDGMLTIADISAERFHGDYAGLSACKTAMGGIELLDEAITLAAALHYMGYRHVVATLWSVHEDASATVFTDVYRRIAVEGALRPQLSAVALHDAVRNLRESSMDAPHLWTPFTHTGP
ncbi:CHAT domain-containing protein [Kribbella sp. NPDC050124]|uniref:CHAT domain-containing protein n=1 Tax=Kribbella sp. NPDC050124 TaxID=3364114 RepID=UPI0037AC264A